jgi:ankyrin repeat protein
MSQVKKSKLQNSQNFKMETIFDRFPTLSDDIFENLGELSLAKCVEVDRKWQTTIANQKVYLRKKIQIWSKNSEQFRKEWNMALLKTPLELLRRLSEYIVEHEYFECDYRLISIEKDSKSCKCLELSPIHFAALHGNIELLKHIEVKTKNKSPKTCDGRTPLHLAAYEGQLEICKWYTKNVGEVNNADNDGWTALHYAADQIEIFKDLLENGADLRLKNKRGQTVLHLAAELGSLKICKLIVEGHEGIDINTNNIDGETPIHIAVENSELEVVKFLFYKGGDLNSRVSSRANGGWRDGDTPLHTAARKSHTVIVKFILTNVVDKNPVNENGKTPLSLAANNGSLETYRLICQYVDDPVPLDLQMEIAMTNHDVSNYFRLMQRAQLAQLEGNPAFSPGF